MALRGVSVYRIEREILPPGSNFLLIEEAEQLQRRYKPLLGAARDRERILMNAEQPRCCTRGFHYVASWFRGRFRLACICCVTSIVDAACTRRTTGVGENTGH